jgi:WD40 repeat protein
MLAIDQGAKGILIVNPSSGDDLNTLAYPVQGTLTAMQAGSKSPTIVFGNSEGSLFIFHSIAPATPVSVVGNVHRGPIYTLALSPDERMLASGGADGRIHLLDMQTASPISSTSVAHDVAITAIGFSPDGSVLASGSADGVIRVWNAKTGQPLSLFMIAHAAPVISIAFDANGSRLFSLGNDSKLNIWTLPHASEKPR